MALYSRNVEKRRSLHDFRRHEEEVVGSLCRLSSRSVSPKSQMEQEKRIRREIANSNERRRMQSINAGFQSLRTLLPHHDGEKLSKAAILQQTAEYIYQLEQEKTRLLTQNCQLKRIVNQQNHDSDGGSSLDSPLPKRKKMELPVVAEPVDEGIGSMSPPGGEESGIEEALKKDIAELRIQLNRERRLRMMFEEQTSRDLAQAYPERIREIVANQVQLKYNSDSPDHQSESYVESLENQESDEHDVVTEESAEISHEERRVPEVMTAEIPTSSSPEPKPAEKIGPSVADSAQFANNRLYVASTSRQNLETIVEAIRHLEGDHLFRDDPTPSATLTQTTTPQVIREMKREEVKTYNNNNNSSCHNTVTALTTSERTKVSTVVCKDFPYRQQVIQVPPVVRPGVIVSTHS